MAQEIEVKVKVVTDQALSGLNNLQNGIKGATNSSKELNNTLSGSKQSEFINQLGDGVGKLNPAFGSAVKGANGLILKMWEIVANPVGAMLAGLVVTAKFLYEAFQNSVAGGKELKAVFAGISAVGEQVKDAMFGLGRALIGVTAAAYKFITLDFKGAADSMKEANREASNSYKQLGNAVDGTTAKIIYNLTKQQQANDKAKKIQDLTQSETNKLLVQSREILTDETASMKDKKKALESVTKAETESSKEKTRIAAEDLRILKDRAKALGGEAEKKMKGEIRDATIALNVAETENAMTGIKLNKQKKMLGRQEVSDAKEAADALKTINEEKKTKAKEAYEADKTALTEKLKEEGLNFQQRRNLIKADLLLNVKDRKKFNDEINKEEQKTIDDHNKAIADLNKKYDDEKANRLADTAVKKEELDYSRRVLEIENLAQTELEKQTLIEKLNGEHLVRMGVAKKTDNDKTIADAEALKKKESDIEQAKFDLKINLWNQTASALSGLGNLFKKGTAASKAAALAEIAIGTATGLINGLDIAQKSAKGTGPAAAFAFPLFYATQVAAVFGAVGKAKSALSGSSGGGGGGASSGGAMAISTPSTMSVNPQVVGDSGVNQLAKSLSAVPLKTYVVAKDVTSQQSLDRNITDTATLG